MPLSRRYYRKRLPYHPQYVPAAFCTAVIYYSLAIVDNTVQWKRPLLDSDFADVLTRGPFSHRNRRIPVYLTIGGDRQNNANFSWVVRDKEKRRRFVVNVLGFLRRYSVKVRRLVMLSSASAFQIIDILKYTYLRTKPVLFYRRNS